jgi:predicted ester cyclase
MDIPSAPNQRAGSAGVKQLLVELTAIFPDFTIRMQDVLQDGNKVIVRSEISATQEKPFMGFAAGHRKMTIQAVDIHELRGGKIVRTWHTEDWMTGFRQLGVCMPPQKTGEDQ